jgi:hypothetical protein
MPVIKPIKHDPRSIIHLQTLQDDVTGIVTAEKEVMLLDAADSSPLVRLKIEEIDVDGSACAFSHDKGYFAFSHQTSKGHALRLIDLHSKQVIRSYATQDNIIERLSFGPSSTYIVAGTATGRVFLWRVDSVNLIARLSSFPEYTPNLLTAPKQNYVSAIAFSDTLVATSGYGGSIVVTNLVTQANTHRLKPGKRRIDALCFLNEHYIVSGNEDGLVEIMHVEEHHPIKRIPTSIGAIRQLFHLKASNMLLAVSKFDHIGLIDLDELEVIDPTFIQFDATIVRIGQQNESTLVAALQNGLIAHVELAPFDTFAEFVQNQDYRNAFLLVESEPLLKYTVDYQALSADYDKAYHKALKALESERPEDAKIFLAPYAKVRQKAQHIQALFTAFDSYRRLKYLIQEKKYAAAYGMVYQYTPLQKTEAYVNLEANWDTIFSKAQKLMIKGEEKRAKAVFGDFLTVPAKSDLIRLMLHKNDLLVALSKAIHRKDFEGIKRITDQEPVIKQLPSYKNALAETNELPERIMRAIKTNQFDKAYELTDELQYIPHLKHHYNRILFFMERAEKLYELLQRGDELRYYEMLDQHRELSILPQSKKMEQKWEKLIHTCEAAAVTGNIATIKNTLGALIRLKTRTDKTGNLLRSAYQVQIKYGITQGTMDRVRRGIEQYVFLFGMDNETRQLIRLIQEQNPEFALTEEQTHHRPRSLWLTMTQGDVPEDITEFE